MVAQFRLLLSTYLAPLQPISLNCAFGPWYCKPNMEVAGKHDVWQVLVGLSAAVISQANSPHQQRAWPASDPWLGGALSLESFMKLSRYCCLAAVSSTSARRRLAQVPELHQKVEVSAGQMHCAACICLLALSKLASLRVCCDTHRQPGRSLSATNPMTKMAR